jgi:sigma-B regulation protein RsbQ
MASRFELHNGRVAGDGPGTLVLAHGYGTDQTAWSRIMPWAAARFRVVLFDLAGAGGAAAYDPGRHADLSGYADDLLAVLDGAGVSRCTYVGHSVSGMIGLLAAVVRPELFERLVLVSSSPRYLNDRDAGYFGGFEQEDLDGLYDAMSENFGAWTAGFAPAVVGVPDHPAVDEFSRTMFSMRPDIALRTARVIFQSDLRAAVPRLRVPAVIVQPRADLAVPMAVAEYLRARLPGSALEAIDAEGHLPHMTAPREIVRVLERHLTPAAMA